MKVYCYSCKQYTEHDTISYGDSTYKDLVSGAGTDYRTVKCVICGTTQTLDFEPDRR